MEYKAEIKTSGIGSGVEMTAQEDLIKHVWNAEYTTNHELRLRRFALYIRASKRHGWKQKDVIGGWDRRGDTLTDMPIPPIELQLIAIREWGKIEFNMEWKR